MVADLSLAMLLNISPVRCTVILSFGRCQVNSVGLLMIIGIKRGNILSFKQVDLY